MNLFDPISRWEPVAKLFRNDSFLQRMLDFEAALAAAEATSGLIPSSLLRCKRHRGKMPRRIIR